MSRIEELKRELELEEQKRRESQRERAEEYNKNPIQNVIEYTVTVHKDWKHLTFEHQVKKIDYKADPEYSKEVVILTKKWVNRDEIMAKMKEEGFVLNNFPDEVVTSVTYYLYHGVLQHTGGGWMLLKTPQLVSPEQWEMLCNGTIPNELMPENEPYKPWG